MIETKCGVVPQFPTLSVAMFFVIRVLTGLKCFMHLHQRFFVFINFLSMYDLHLEIFIWMQSNIEPGFARDRVKLSV